MPRPPLVLAILVSFTPALMQAQGPGRAARDTVARLPEVTVTATRSTRAVFGTPHPVTVIDSTTIQRAQGNNAADLLRSTPGIDVIGVGPNQNRVAIRGQRGQRILILEDGIRLNNSRRQQDFGEVPAIVGTNDLRRVELVRGPASVLYGSDAIGGVMNMVTIRAPAGGSGRSVAGNLGYRYAGAGNLQQLNGTIAVQQGRFGLSIGAQYRDADPYQAPKGTFGNVTLNTPVRVEDSGVQDANYHAELGYGTGASARTYLRYTRYDAKNAGFGFVEPEQLGDPGGSRIRLYYPEQVVDRLSLGYSNTGIRSFLADRVDLTGYALLNQRNFSRSILVPIGPGATLAADSRTLTDSRTNGFRAEAAKSVGRHILTYGLDFFDERSDNSDSSRTVVTGFGPPSTQVSTTPSVPNAAYRSRGLFAQGELRLAEWVDLVVGARFQDVTAETRPTVGLSDALTSSSDNALVGSANLGVGLTPHLKLVVAAGRAFRSPNLIERFFSGPTSDGSGFQRPNPDLVPETSLNFDLGLKYQRGALYAEGFVFRNEIQEGVRIARTGDTQQGRPVFQNINVEKLREVGVELQADLRVVRGIFLGGTFTNINSTNVAEPEIPVGDNFSSRATGAVTYREPAGKFYAGYELRHNGVRKEVDLGSSPIGDQLPAFTVSNLRGGAHLFSAGRTAHRVDLLVGNLFNKLYAEFPNAGFFRPEPGRHASMSWTVSF
ncbi:MAG: TonB-dependent receptor [Gemmatimonadota bacterium]|nr:TonB-dependent receptor [Gemmatimonadota bacterium]